MKAALLKKAIARWGPAAVLRAAGQEENCQIGVFACLGLATKQQWWIFDFFLPESWAQSAERCDKAQIPEDQRQHRTN